MLAVLREHWIAGINAHELRFDHGHVVAELRSDAANFDLIASMIFYRMVDNVLTFSSRSIAHLSWTQLFMDIH